jgi:hypothetical protein
MDTPLTARCLCLTLVTDGANGHVLMDEEPDGTARLDATCHECSAAEGEAEARSLEDVESGAARERELDDWYHSIHDD